MTIGSEPAVATPVPVGPPRTAYAWVRWRGRLPFAVGITLVLVTIVLKLVKHG